MPRSIGISYAVDFVCGLSLVFNQIQMDTIVNSSRFIVYCTTMQACLNITAQCLEFALQISIWMKISFQDRIVYRPGQVSFCSNDVNVELGIIT